MLNKELKYVHDKSYLQRHPKLQPKMRAILLDWLLEVRTQDRGDHVRFTLCLQVFLNVTFKCLRAGERGVQPPPADGLPRPGLLRPLHADPAERQQGLPAAHRHHVALHRLQDRGESSSLVRHSTANQIKPPVSNQTSSSPQEIYPPKIYEFAYVTDGACDMWDIQRTELHILKVQQHKRC